MCIRKIISGADYKKWLQTWGRFYVSGNCVEGYSDVTADNWQDGVFGQMDAKIAKRGEVQPFGKNIQA